MRALTKYQVKCLKEFLIYISGQGSLSFFVDCRSKDFLAGKINSVQIGLFELKRIYNGVDDPDIDNFTLIQIGQSNNAKSSRFMNVIPNVIFVVNQFGNSSIIIPKSKPKM